MLTKNASITNILFLLICTIVVSGIPWGVFISLEKIKSRRRYDKNYALSTIVQTSTIKGALNTQYLAEILDLSRDRMVHYDKFVESTATEKLLKLPIIYSAEVKKIKPNKVYISYEMRSPVALFGDYENMGIDDNGKVFPIYPFYPEEHRIRLFSASYLKRLQWGDSVYDKNTQLALKIIQYLKKSSLEKKVYSVDTSLADVLSYGRREVIIWLKDKIRVQTKIKKCDCTFNMILRLTPDGYKKQLSNFRILRANMIRDFRKQLLNYRTTSDDINFSPQVLDFRMDDFAIIN